MMVEFRVLGPLEMVVDGRVVPVSASRLRSLLAVFLVRANNAVGYDEIIEAVWGEAVPAKPRPAVYTLVARLRGLLGDLALVEAVGDGYRIVVDEAHVDLKRYEHCLEAAKTAGPREADLLAEALGMWRGQPLVNVSSDYLHRRVVQALVERRLQVLERKLSLDVEQGRHESAVPDLRQLTSDHPLRERFWALFMLALFRSGRQADALAAFSAVRQRLADELGVDPGAELRQAQQTVLAGDQDSGWRVECQLPIDVADFINRDEELAAILDVMRPGATVPIMTISGPPGMGKSALMVRAAHQLIAEYPDGQWFLRLGGASPAPRRANELLAEILRIVGVDPLAIPDGTEERSSLLRSRLSGRRVLLVLDDAGSVEQIAPLLPGRPGSGVLVSSRSELADVSVLYGGKRLALKPLPPQHARDLVASIVGAQRCAQDEAASAELADLCGRLPLALRIAAANLAGRPGLKISHYARDLRTGDRLAKLETTGGSGLAVRAAFDLSFAALSEREQCAFSLLGVTPGLSFSQQAAAALIGCGNDEAVAILDRLAAANLVEEQSDGQFGFHDLIRVYAADRSREYGRDEAFVRLAEWYLRTIHAAVSKAMISVYVSPLAPPTLNVDPIVFTTNEEALAWLESERPNHLAMIEYAAANGPVDYAWRLTDAARPYMYHRFRIAEMDRAAGLGLERAKEAGDRRAVAMMLLILGASESITGRFDDSVRNLTESRVIAAELGETGIQAAALTSLATSYSEAALPAEAVRCGQQALELVGRGVEQGVIRRMSALVTVGMNSVAIGRIAEGLECLREVCALALPYRSSMTELASRLYLGLGLCRAGQYEEALPQFQRVMELAVEQHMAHNEHIVGLALVHCALGDMDQATEFANRALEQARDNGYLSNEAQSLNALGTIALSVGDSVNAFDKFHQALKMARTAVARTSEIEALTGMALAGHNGEHAAEALRLAREHGLRLLEANALTALADTKLRRGQADEALRIAEQALAMHREFGCVPGEREASAVISGVKGN